MIWKENKYESIVNIMGGFYILLVTPKVIYKYYNLMGLKEWWLKSKIIAAGSVDQAIEVRHYSRAVRLYKQFLEPLLRYKSEKEIPFLPTDVYKKIKELRLHPSHTTIQNVISMPEWPTLQEKLLKISSTMRK